MQAVPSLVGTGTVVAAASTGLVFGQPSSDLAAIPASSSSQRQSRPSSPLVRKAFTDFGLDSSRATPTPPPVSRPGTSPAVSLSQPGDGYPGPTHDHHHHHHPAPLNSHPVGTSGQPAPPSKQVTPPKAPSRRQSYIRPADTPAAAAPPAPSIHESSRDSFQSHHSSSWIRRLSLRPGSQQDSPRSSLGPDSSFSFSQASGGSAVLSPTVSLTPTVPPNKLIKRFGSTHESIFSRRQSKGEVPSLRRPATSHQRSATAQQLPASPDADMTFDRMSLGPVSRPRASTTGQAHSPLRLQEPSSWTSFFHMRRVKTSRRANVVSPSAESSLLDYPLPRMRIRVRHGSFPRPFLIKPQSISDASFEVATAESELDRPFTMDMPAHSEMSPRDSDQVLSEQSDSTPARRARRSLSTQFRKATASSLRRSKRKIDESSATRRYASDPTSSAIPDAARSGGGAARIDDLFTPPKSAHRPGQNLDICRSHEQSRDCSSPIPPLSRLSTFNLGMGPSPPPSAGLLTHSPTQFSPTAAPFGAPVSLHSRAVSKEGASTLAGSEMSVPGLASGDDDTDYRSDALFDSFRTTDTNRLRMAETPLDTMFDESLHGPPGNVKTKRLSIQEILGNSWDGNTRILEEDEGGPTPMRGLRGLRIADDSYDAEDRATEMARFQLSMGDRGMGRLSLDTTDDDYDWAKDDEEAFSNPLSPPTSSVNLRRGPSLLPLRSALSRISDKSTSDGYTVASPTERPRSNLFDWSEPSQEKNDDGVSRPRTAHGKQESDPRGGRSSNRKSLAPAHIRSQSVPVVHDPIENTKNTPKFGTWAVGNKNASEEWDDDFDFDEASHSGSSSRPPRGLLMRVPESIQATQPTVKAHSGQIRELSLLVSSLKRLCRQGRELNLTGGQAASLWKEAENIISLASPDEEDGEAEGTDSDRSFSDFDPSMIDERFLDEGFDASTLDRSEGSTDDLDRDIPKNSVVKEKKVARRRSVFSPDDDIFGNSSSLGLPASATRPHTPRTPDRVREFHTPDGTVVSSVIAAMEQQRSQPNRPPESPLRPSTAKLFFDTNSLQELVKRANSIFHTLSDIVRREELLTMSPQATPRHDRHRRGGSPAFTRVFSGPDEGSPRHLVKSQKSHSPIPRSSLESNGLGQRMQMMTVS